MPVGARIALAAAAAALLVAAEARADARLLVFSKTTGYRHDSIPDAIAALEQLAPDHGWTITATEDAAVFTDGTLAEIDVAVFMMNTGDVLDEAQQAGLQAFVEAGHGFVGIHSVTNAEEEWPWFEQLLATRFADHPAQQDAIVHVAAPTHPACVGLPEPWPRFDEWYNFTSNPSRSVDVLLWLDESSYEGGTMGRNHPIAWTHVLGDARVFYTAAGHTSAAWADAAWLGHVAGGIDWVSEGEPPSGSSESESESGGGSSEGGTTTQGSGTTGSTSSTSTGESSTAADETGTTTSSSTGGAVDPPAGCGCDQRSRRTAPLLFVLAWLRRRSAHPRR